MTTNRGKNENNQKDDWYRRTRYFISLLSVVVMLLQTFLPVVVAAESLGENESIVTEVHEPAESIVSEPEEAPIIVPPAEEPPAEVPVVPDPPAESVTESQPVPEAPEEPEKEPEPTLMDFRVTVKWQDGNNIDELRPSSLTVYRLDNSVNNNVTATLSSDNQWTYTWRGIRDDVSYSIEKLNLPSGYSSIVDNSNPAHIVITNHYTPKPRESTSQENESKENESDESSEESSDDDSDDSDGETSDDEEENEDETAPEDSLITPFSISPPEEDRAITYNFFLSETDTTPFQTQIILDQESLIMPEVPTGQRNFLGWFAIDGGQESAVAFGTPITVTESSPETVNVYAKFENAHYVQFMQLGVVIMTKVVQDGDPVDPSDVPVMEDIDGDIFAHWSLSENGPAFDFSQPIQDDTTLYAVSIQRHKISFNSDGGTSQLPIYVEDGATIDFSGISVAKEGYSFSQ